MEHCVGCRTAKGPVCPECADLLDRPIEVRRSLALPALLGSLGLLMVAAGLHIAFLRYAIRGGRAVASLLFLGILATVLSIRDLGRPWRVRLYREIEVRWFPWKRARLPVREVTFGAGVIEHRPSGIRLRLGDLDYPEAETLRRALRVRIAMRV